MVSINDATDGIVFAIVVLARLIVPLAIPRHPVPALVTVLAIDAVDQSVFQAFTDIELDGYQTYDKALDVYYLMIAYASTIRNWGGGFAFQVGRVLWYYRLVGVVLFEYLDARWLLFVFPNTFEYFFLAIELWKSSRNPFTLTKRQVIGIAAAIWVVIKLPQEWWLHVAELDFTDEVKHRVFGVSVTDDWVDAVQNRPGVVVLIVVALAALVAALRWASRLLPPPDWPRTWDADVQGNHLGWPTPPDEAVPVAYFGWPFVEKAFLVVCVTLIFGQILPGGEESPVDRAVGTAAIVTISTFVSQAFARRGVTWRSTAVQFVVMGGLNTVSGMVAAALLPGVRNPPFGTYLFLVLLLTLIVVLFDQFKRIDRDPRRRMWMRRAAHALRRSPA